MLCPLHKSTARHASQSKTTLVAMAVDKVVAGGGKAQQSEPELEPAAEASTFAELGICPELVEACDAMGWKQPTKIQAGAIPHALKGTSIIFSHVYVQF